MEKEDERVRGLTTEQKRLEAKLSKFTYQLNGYSASTINYGGLAPCGNFIRFKNMFELQCLFGDAPIGVVYSLHQQNKFKAAYQNGNLAAQMNLLDDHVYSMTLNLRPGSTSVMTRLLSYLSVAMIIAFKADRFNIHQCQN